MTREPVLPAVRAAVFTAVCLGLSVAAHRMMSATAIPAYAVVLGGVGVYVAARVGATRECGLVGIAALMGALQFALHILFAIAQETSAPAMSTTMPGMSMPAGSSMSMPGMAMAQPADGMRMGTGMLLAHVLAALVCALWLRCGEAALHTLVRSVAYWVVEHFAVRVHVVPVAARIQRSRRLVDLVRVLRAQWLLTSVLLRGPPLSSPLT